VRGANNAGCKITAAGHAMVKVGKEQYAAAEEVEGSTSGGCRGTWGVNDGQRG